MRQTVQHWFQADETLERDVAQLHPALAGKVVFFAGRAFGWACVRFRQAS